MLLLLEGASDSPPSNVGAGHTQFGGRTVPLPVFLREHLLPEERLEREDEEWLLMRKRKPY